VVGVRRCERRDVWFENEGGRGNGGGEERIQAKEKDAEGQGERKDRRGRLTC
jgi:hypothetical protein